MRKSHVYIIVGMSAFLIMYFKNPNINEHVGEIENALTANLISNKSGNQINNSFQLTSIFFIEKFIEKSVYRTDFLFFSISGILLNGQKKNLGVGFFGKVFLLEETQNLFTEISVTSKPMVRAKGVKYGSLNYIVKTKENVYKGKLISVGNNNVQSHEFDFYVEDDAVVRKLKEIEGQNLTIGYKEYEYSLYGEDGIFVVDKVF